MAAVALLSALTVALLVPGISQAETLQYSYDTIQRLTRVVYGDGTTIDYTYDNAGNRLTKSITLSGAPANRRPAR